MRQTRRAHSLASEATLKIQRGESICDSPEANRADPLRPLGVSAPRTESLAPASAGRDKSRIRGW